MGGPVGAPIDASLYQGVVNRLSHELGGPLSVLRGYMSLWIDGTLDPAPWSTAGEIERQMPVVNTLIGTVRDLAGRLDPDRVPISKSELDRWSLAAGALAEPIAGLRSWLQGKDRGLIYQMTFGSAQAALVCERNSILLEALVNQLAAVQAVGGNQEAELRPLDLSDWLRKAVHELAPAVTCFRHTLAMDFSAARAPVLGDPVLLSVALLNLLDNAQKFSAPGQSIRVSGFVGDSTAGFEVEDSGPGLPRGFELRAFGRIDEGPGFASPGMGLGLYTANRVAELHHGLLTFRSIERIGTAFRVQIPFGGE